MAKEVHSTSEEGNVTHSEIREFETTLDANGEEAPDTLESLLAAYASCLVPALRVGAKQRDVGDLGQVEIDATGELNDDDKLESIALDIRVEEDLGGNGDQVIERARELCKVHDALKDSLHADMSIEGGAT